MSDLPISVAIIDDDDLYRAIVVRILLRSGMSVAFQANDGKSGIEQMSGCLTLPSIVIMDIEMPVMGGFETAKLMKEQWPLVPIVAHSSLTNRDVANGMIDSGADFFISKSAGIEQLAHTIKRLAVSNHPKIS
jgi:DNA-binding NarL/FixJ family response regulator